MLAERFYRFQSRPVRDRWRGVPRRGGFQERACSYPRRMFLRIRSTVGAARRVSVYRSLRKTVHSKARRSGPKARAISNSMGKLGLSNAARILTVSSACRFDQTRPGYFSQTEAHVDALISLPINLWRSRQRLKVSPALHPGMRAQSVINALVRPPISGTGR
ncbi:MAG: hypothetical protein JWL59_4804 [Chthoniobacteraceae bacterium]|nr:hypothetical protein [Chthoniobacteraceae bacterium]